MPETWPFERADAQLDYGVWLCRQHRAGEVREQLCAAHQVFTRLDAAPWASLAETELRAAGVRLEGDAQPGTSWPGSPPRRATRPEAPPSTRGRIQVTRLMPDPVRVAQDRAVPPGTTGSNPRRPPGPDPPQSSWSTAPSPTPPGPPASSKPAWGTVSASDTTINPDVERFGYERENRDVTEVDSSHLVVLSHPEQVADVIREALATISS